MVVLGLWFSSQKEVFVGLEIRGDSTGLSFFVAKSGVGRRNTLFKEKYFTSPLSLTQNLHTLNCHQPLEYRDSMKVVRTSSSSWYGLTGLSQDKMLKPATPTYAPRSKRMGAFRMGLVCWLSFFQKGSAASRSSKVLG